MEITFDLVWKIVWFIIKAMADVLVTMFGFAMLGVVFYLLLTLTRRILKRRKNG